MGKILTNDDMISKIREIHGDLYSFEKFTYKSYKEKPTLICKKHGDFKISLVNLIGNKRGCPKCGLERGHKSCLSNIEDFIIKANNVHNNKYNYSESEYVNWKTHLTIICKNHGKFKKTPNEHLNGLGCPICKKDIKYNNKKILIKIDKKLNRKSEMSNKFFDISKNIHMNKYDYSLSKYERSNSKIKIICKKHGIFEQTPHHHERGTGCPSCSYENKIGVSRMNTYDFISLSKKRHNNYYDYSLSDYKGHKEKVKIICQKHGIFEQRPRYHMNGGGCPKCNCGQSGGRYEGGFKYTNDEFIEKCSIRHSNKYDYSKTEFNGVKDKVKVICKTHGEFEIQAYHHSNGVGCLKCSIDNKKIKTLDFIERSNKIHDNKYEYLINKEYTESKELVKIKCKEHGIFEQISDTHLKGSGCTLCKTKSRGEIRIKNYLEKTNINYIREKTFEDCSNNKKLRFDFYLPEKSIIVEYDGKHHYKPIDWFGGEYTLNKMIISDNIKNEYCSENNIKLIRIPYTQLKNIVDILKKELTDNVELKT